MPEIILKEESFRIIGICMSIHNELGMGFREVIYKDALELEFIRNKIPFIREKLFTIEYKGEILKHRYQADFIVFNQLVLEIKAASRLLDDFVVQTINYLKISGLPLGIIINFGQKSLVFQRVVI